MSTTDPADPATTLSVLYKGEFPPDFEKVVDSWPTNLTKLSIAVHMTGSKYKNRFYEECIHFIYQHARGMKDLKHLRIDAALPFEPNIESLETLTVMSLDPNLNPKSPNPVLYPSKPAAWDTFAQFTTIKDLVIYVPKEYIGKMPSSFSRMVGEKRAGYHDNGEVYTTIKWDTETKPPKPTNVEDAPNGVTKTKTKALDKASTKTVDMSRPNPNNLTKTLTLIKPIKKALSKQESAALATARTLQANREQEMLESMPEPKNQVALIEAKKNEGSPQTVPSKYKPWETPATTLMVNLPESFPPNFEEMVAKWALNTTSLTVAAEMDGEKYKDRFFEQCVHAIFQRVCYMTSLRTLHLNFALPFEPYNVHLQTLTVCSLDPNIDPRRTPPLLYPMAPFEKLIANCPKLTRLYLLSPNPWHRVRGGDMPSEVPNPEAWDAYECFNLPIMIYVPYNYVNSMPDSFRRIVMNGRAGFHQ
ncbi:hypothetical protein SARC_02679 [Sphaeroforma arctica JP610]|uniref:Uncharacterized protein n=1 Tax=Sphaeroforma arctica JP610 TaxID=667725 RepID=A0A0L0G895_9EUKA|nr:hypothetical protein SARC_02679 [Sphaeroforma arctica JP610]KNC85124.1 hypothetical protein SARC_02679 [Sphaeroforma arctica JP610]|eukprot:XP_014159026.1 hypothetical protein SARC_02679 [Sphaeroforma arctica JP610]